MCYNTLSCIWQIPCALGFMVGSFDRVVSMDDAVAEAEEFAAQQGGEIWAEAKMSWICGGGSPEDANFYAGVVASGRDWGEVVSGMGHGDATFETYEQERAYYGF